MRKPRLWVDGENAVTTLHLQAVVGPDGRIKLDIPCDLPPGPAEIVIVISAPSEKPTRSWHDITGVGREIWKDTDAQGYVNGPRDEWDR